MQKCKFRNRKKKVASRLTEEENVKDLHLPTTYESTGLSKRIGAKFREFSLNFPKLSDWLCMGWPIFLAVLARLGSVTLGFVTLGLVNQGANLRF